MSAKRYKTIEAFQKGFWELLDKNTPSGCWNWTKGLATNGYGIVYAGRKYLGERAAHRTAWVLENARPVPTGLFVLHHCDNRRCCNPAHLFIGTKSDNSQDCVRKGRNYVPTLEERRKCYATRNTARGERVGTSKLSTSDVVSILASPLKGVVLAQQFNVHPALISMIRNRKAWKHINAT